MQNNIKAKGIRINPLNKIEGEIKVPGDKSISHRAALFGGMAKGETHITNYLLGEDCLSTLECLKGLGVEWERRDTEVWIHGRGLDNWQEPKDILDVGNSGTTMRLILGVLAGCPFSTTLTGDASIRSRPMGRVTIPLQGMGARILGRQEGKYAPLTIQGGSLQGIQYSSPVASAQVKSAILLAGLKAKGETAVTEPFLSRDHTERLLRGFGVDLISEGSTAKVKGGAVLSGQEVAVPGDISSAAFLLVLGTLIHQGELLIKNVGLNKTRTGILEALWQMGADIQVEDEREECGEPRGNLRVRPAQLHGIEIKGEMIPRLIDEVPILALAASLARGETVIRDATELRVKETDRINTVAQGLQSMGAKVEELPDGLRIQGVKRLRGGSVQSHGDHRLAMTWVVAGLLSEEGVALEGLEAAAVSFPDFLGLIREISY